MDFKYAAPEEMGISSRAIERFLEVLEEKRLSTHSVIIARGDKLLLEHYYAPFDRETPHRMYSVTKSFVSLAIGFLEQEGRLSLDDPLSLYFPEESRSSHPFQKAQTIRHTLMMASAMPNTNHFKDKPEDRVAHFFARRGPGARPSGTLFRYDSESTFVLGALVERLTGMKLFDYLKERLFDKIGVGKVDCLSCPGGHSWSDSALICRPIDLLRVARFCMKGGEGILNEAYLRAATSKQIDNATTGHADQAHQGYGYLFWRSFDNSFLFSGMGCQLALCIPEKDLILVYNGDNQGYKAAKDVILESFFRLIVRPAGAPLPADEPVRVPEARLHFVKGEIDSPTAHRIQKKCYLLEENPMGITRLSLSFEGDEGTLSYTNAQGDKAIRFGLGKNLFGLFPQIGYSDRVATEAGDRLYRYAASGAWVSENKLFIKVQIIDTYFGILNINLGFRDQAVGLEMNKSAEDFLNEYTGYAGGIAE